MQGNSDNGCQNGNRYPNPILIFNDPKQGAKGKALYEKGGRVSISVTTGSALVVHAEPDDRVTDPNARGTAPRPDGPAGLLDIACIITCIAWCKATR